MAEVFQAFLREEDVQVDFGSGKVENLVVREAVSGVATAYRNMIYKATKLNDGKVSGVDGLADTEPFLVARCTFRRDPTSERGVVPIGEAEVRCWPDGLVQHLLERVKKVNPGLVKEKDRTLAELRKAKADIEEKIKALEGPKPTSEEEELKNSQGPATRSSASANGSEATLST